MISYLESFSKRMELIAEIASVICRSKRNKIEERFKSQELDNIIIAVLVHIMECSLTDKSKCTLDDIENFLSDLLIDYNYEFPDNELREITRYIVKDVLQNRGEIFKYNIMDHINGTMKIVSVRLIKDIVDDDNTIYYVLDNQGFDMLFRSKEVDDELGFQMEEIRLQKLIENGNYTKASDQSKTLINMLNQKEIELDLFERQLKNDLNTTSGEEYESIIDSIEKMLNDEYSVMNDVKKAVRKAAESFEKRTVFTDAKKEKLEQKRKEIFVIEKNIEAIIVKQRKLLSHSRGLGDVYRAMLSKTIISRRERCFDIEDVILKQLEEYDGRNKLSIDEICAMLTGTLAKPKLPDTLNIGLFYEPQKIREESSGDNVEVEEPDNNDEYIKELEYKNKANTEIIKLLLEFASDCDREFRLEELWEYAKQNYDIDILAEDRRFFLIILKLYEFIVIDLDAWKLDPNKTDDCQGEFDLSYSLVKIYENNRELYGIKRIIIENTYENMLFEFSFTDKKTGLKIKETIETDNMRFIVEV